MFIKSNFEKKKFLNNNKCSRFMCYIVNVELKKQKLLHSFSFKILISKSKISLRNKGKVF